MIALALLLASADVPPTAAAAPAAPAAASAPAAAAPAAVPAGAVVEAKPKILVLDFRDDGVGPNVVRIVHDTLVSHVSKDDRLEVISSEDVRQAVQREAEKRENTNCDEAGCLAEIAEALGAQLTLYGTAGKLGELVVVNVNLYDARAARSVGRETIEVDSLERLLGPLRAAGDKLIAQLGLKETAPTGWSPGPVLWTGAAIMGAGIVANVIGLAIYFPNIDAVSDATSFEDKTNAKVAQDTGAGIAVTGAVATLVGVVIGAASFALE